MEYRLDSHTHTLASGHAYNTITEMAAAAAQKGLDLLAITEHAPAMPGTAVEFYFMNLKVLPRKMCGIEVLFGTELNILDFTGKIDLPERALERMDVCIASLHTPCIRPGSVRENTDALLGAIKNPYVNILGHPDDGRYPVDYDTVVAAAAEHHVLLELNNHSLDKGCTRANARENDMIMLERCMHYHAPIIMDSDAHWAGDVGNTRNTICLIEEMDFPEELIVNRSVSEYKKYINTPG